MLKNIQNLMTKFVTGNLKVAEEKLYLPVEKGGLQLINVKNFITGLQCTWVKRAYESSCDNWRVNIRNVCMGNPYILSPELVREQGCSLLMNISMSFDSFRASFYKKEGNIRDSYIMHNKLVHRGENSQTCINAAFFAGNRPNLNLQEISNITVNDLLINNTLKNLGTIEDDLGVIFSLATYLRLGEAMHLVLTRYARSLHAVSQTLPNFFKKKGGEAKRVRRICEHEIVNKKNIDDNTTFKTFCRLSGLVTEEFLHKSKVFSFWSRNFLSNKVRDFFYRYLNNQLPINTRVSHYVNNVVRTCTFCMLSRNQAPEDESFVHLFLDCSVTSGIHNWLLRKYMPAVNWNRENKKLLFFGGAVEGNQHFNDFSFLIAVVTQFYIWEMKLQKRVLAPLTINQDINFEIRCCVRKNRKLLVDMVRMGMQLHDFF
jgi:hypothetical protein